MSQKGPGCVILSLHLDKWKPDALYFTSVVPDDLVITSTKLRNKTSYGYDEISTKILKESIGEIAIPLSHICNRSFQIGVVSRVVSYELQLAKITPIIKSGEKTIIVDGI